MKITLLTVVIALAAVFAGSCDKKPWKYSCQKDLQPFERNIYTPTHDHFVELNGNDVYYLDAGDPNGNVVIFLHGQPTGAYSWRHLMPWIAGCDDEDYIYDNACNGNEMSGVGRAIAWDMLGYGRSSKPTFIDEFDYRILSHTDQFEDLMDALNLGLPGGPNVTLVGQDWGGGVALSYIAQHPERVHSFVCIECVFFAQPDPEFPPFFDVFNKMRTYEGQSLVLDDQLFVEHQLLKSPPFQDRISPYNFLNFTLREYTDAEKRYYRFPWLNREDRKPQLVLPAEIVQGSGYPSDLNISMTVGRDTLLQGSQPKLFLPVTPGLIWPQEAVDVLPFLVSDPTSLNVTNVGAGVHYVQEELDTIPTLGAVLREWFDREVNGN